MYQIIQSIISHSWITQGAGDQQYIYYICGAVICIFFALLYDSIVRLFDNVFRR